MSDKSTYEIKVRDQVDENDLSETSPVQLTLECLEGTATTFSIRTDQSGLIGLLRHFHSRGLTLLSVICDQ